MVACLGSLLAGALVGAPVYRRRLLAAQRMSVHSNVSLTGRENKVIWALCWFAATVGFIPLSRTMLGAVDCTSRDDGSFYTWDRDTTSSYNDPALVDDDGVHADGASLRGSFPCFEGVHYMFMLIGITLVVPLAALALRLAPDAGHLQRIKSWIPPSWEAFTTSERQPFRGPLTTTPNQPRTAMTNLAAKLVMVAATTLFSRRVIVLALTFTVVSSAVLLLNRRYPAYESESTQNALLLARALGAWTCLCGLLTALVDDRTIAWPAILLWLGWIAAVGAAARAAREWWLARKAAREEELRRTEAAAEKEAAAKASAAEKAARAAQRNKEREEARAKARAERDAQIRATALADTEHSGGSRGGGGTGSGGGAAAGPAGSSDPGAGPRAGVDVDNGRGGAAGVDVSAKGGVGPAAAAVGGGGVGGDTSGGGNGLGGGSGRKVRDKSQGGSQGRGPARRKHNLRAVAVNITHSLRTAQFTFPRGKSGWTPVDSPLAIADPTAIALRREEYRRSMIGKVRGLRLGFIRPGAGAGDDGEHDQKQDDPGTAPSPASGEYRVAPLLGRFSTQDSYDYTLCHVGDVSAYNAVVLRVAAANDAHVALGETLLHDGTHYELCFGGGGNTWSAIRRRNQGPGVAEARGPALPSADDVAKGEAATFWVSWRDGERLRVGRGSVVGADVLMEADQADIDVTHMHVATGWGATGEWEVGGDGGSGPLTAVAREGGRGGGGGDGPTPELEAVMSAVIGRYECHLYDGGGKNDYHYVTIERDPDPAKAAAGGLRWVNRCTSWELTASAADKTRLAVGTDCVYHAEGHHVATVVYDGETVVRCLGPWDEPYDREEGDGRGDAGSDAASTRDDPEVPVGGGDLATAVELPALVAAVAGTYECHVYDGSDNKNDWHYVTVTVTDAGKGLMQWANRAGATWALTAAASDRGKLVVGTDCPYYGDGYHIATVEWEGDAVSRLLGPWDEPYERET